MDIDDLVRDFRADLPQAVATRPSEAARRAMTGRPRRQAGRLARRTGRLVAIASGGLATAAIATVLVLLFVASPDRATLQVGTPRADWGLTATVRVEPRLGGAPGDDVERVIQGLEDRARHGDIAGLRIARTAPDTLALTIPGTDLATDVTQLVSFPSIDLFNLSTTLIARGPDLNAVAEPASRLPGPMTRYAVSSGGLGMIEIVPTQADAERRLRQQGWEDGAIVPLPDGVLLVERYLARTREVMLVRDQPIVTAEQLDRARFAGSRLELVPVERASATVAAVIQTQLTPGDPPTFAVIARDGAGRRYEYAESAAIEATPTSLVLTGLPERSDDLTVFGGGGGQPVIAATVTVQSTEPYGTVPLPSGDRLTALPESLRTNPKYFTQDGASVDVPTDSIVQANTITSGARTWVLYAGRTTSGREAAWIDGGGDTEIPLGTCWPGIGIPLLRSCGGFGINRDGVFVGRARSEVVAIEARERSGETHAGSVRNGWFLIPYRAALSPSVEIIGRDAGGRVVATVDRSGHLVLPPAVTGTP